MYYDSCSLFGNPWAAYLDHCKRLEEIFKKDEERHQKDIEKTKNLEKEFLNKSTQEN